MTRAFLCLACHESLSWRFLSPGRSCAFSAWLHCSKVYLMCGENAYLGFHRSDAPPPAELRFQTAHSSSQGASVGTAALLLPAVVRFFSKSLPHLLPRQAFSFSGPWYQSPSASCGSCPLSSVLSDDRVIPNSRTDRLNGNTEASRISAFSKTMSTSDTGPDTVLLRVA